MLTREQKDQLENLLEMSEVQSLEIGTTREWSGNGTYNSVGIHLVKGSDLIPVEEAVKKILAMLRVDHRGPLEIEPTEDLYSTEIHTEEGTVNIYVRRDKEVSASVEAI